jgi:copper(I)-binding protein
MNKLILTLAMSFACLSAQAAVEITDAWARATPPGQEVGAAYMNLKSDRAARLIGASSSTAGSIEIHEMSMKNGVMKMRMMETMPLPAGKMVKLAPGGFHLMLFDLKKPLTAGETIEIELSVKDAKDKIGRQKISLPVKTN